jgi:hypothetical protein
MRRGNYRFLNHATTPRERSLGVVALSCGLAYRALATPPIHSPSTSFMPNSPGCLPARNFAAASAPAA